MYIDVQPEHAGHAMHTLFVGARLMAGGFGCRFAVGPMHESVSDKVRGTPPSNLPAAEHGVSGWTSPTKAPCAHT
ncbi:MAG: hypothetical protein ACR2IK_21620 [Chloroflexota bacterium]